MILHDFQDLAGMALLMCETGNEVDDALVRALVDTVSAAC